MTMLDGQSALPCHELGWNGRKRAYHGASSEATWRSGYVADCKSAHPGSIPGVASKFIEAGKGRMERDETI